MTYLRTNLLPVWSSFNMRKGANKTPIDANSLTELCFADIVIISLLHTLGFYHNYL